MLSFLKSVVPRGPRHRRAVLSEHTVDRFTTQIAGNKITIAKLQRNIAAEVASFEKMSKLAKGEQPSPVRPQQRAQRIRLFPESWSKPKAVFQILVPGNKARVWRDALAIGFPHTD